jgi:myosin protein heavy chain
MFVLEQEEYAREGISDNLGTDFMGIGEGGKGCIELIAGGGEGVVGVLSLLDEECIMPKATDETFGDKVITTLYPWCLAHSLLRY